MNSKLEQLKEYARIIKDTPYALRTYLQTYDNTQKKFVPMNLFPDQLQLIQDYEDYNENITKKYRQAVQASAGNETANVFKSIAVACESNYCLNHT